MSDYAVSAAAENDARLNPFTGRRSRLDRPGLIARGLENLVADSELLNRCPNSDRNNVRAIAVQLLTVRSFYWIIMSFALVAAFGGSEAAIGLSIAGAFIPASLLYGFDLLMVRASFPEHGMRALRKRANFGQRALAEAASNGLRLTLRLFLSILGANVFALFFVMFYAHSSIGEQMVIDYRAAHQALYGDVRANYGSRIAAQEQIVDREFASMNNINTELTEVNRIIIGEDNKTSVSEGSASHLRSEIAALNRQVLGAQEEVRKYADLADCEKHGEKHGGQLGERCLGATGVPGPFKMFHAAKDHQRNAELSLSSLQAQLANNEQRLQDILKAAARRSEDLTELLKASRVRHDAAAKNVQELRSQRDTAIDADVQRLEPMSDGPFIQLKALYQLAHNSEAVSRLWVNLELLIIALELTAIVAALSIDPKGVYPILVAERHEREATEASCRLVIHSANCESQIASYFSRGRSEPPEVASGGGSPRPQPPNGPSSHAVLPRDIYTDLSATDEKGAPEFKESSGTSGEPERGVDPRAQRRNDQAPTVVLARDDGANHSDADISDPEPIPPTKEPKHVSSSPGDYRPQKSSNAGVSLMITQAQKERLRKRGYSDEHIHNMPPSVAHTILSAGED